MWLLKIFFKIILSRLPIKHSIWRKIGIFNNGGMNKTEYAKFVFFNHLDELKKINNIHNPVIMEIGPGEGIGTAILSRIHNAKKVYLIDASDFLDKDINKYINIMHSLEKDLFNEDKYQNFSTFDELLKAFNTTYLSDGLESLKTIKENSVDYIFSHSTMEHIRLKEVDQMIKEMYRVIKPKGLISHSINYRDHLSGSLNNLRFSEKLWESDFFSNSGFYTNRIPAFEMHKKFSKKGFQIIQEKFRSWENLPIKRKYLHKHFQKYDSYQLINYGSSIIATKE